MVIPLAESEHDISRIKDGPKIILRMCGLANTDRDFWHSKADASVPSAPVHKSSQIANLKEKLAKKDEYIKKLTEENTALKQECELIRGRLFLLMQRHSME